ncbi:MAG: radical SAM family heme chaperone HemW [Isosphaeraceae bacterium]|nr:radical SAM family heme chaperone HemW [Isosphaeraceae bacterium]
MSPPDSKLGRPAHPPRAAYIHIPFCAHKCGYCDFASLAGADDQADRYLAALALEVERLGGPHEVDTIFIGGGTPTRLDAGQLRRLVDLVRSNFPLAPGGEWTIEANPGTLDERKADIMADAGVERVSLGAQSFRVESLRVLERNHGPDEVARALEIVRPRFPRWSFDLIFGVPGSSTADWERDLEIAFSLGPRHLSAYGLTYEKGTALWKQWSAGEVTSLDEEIERSMYEYTLDRMAAEGLTTYEISNHAAPGHECRHNLVYWANEPYFGVGLGAARYVDGVRATNTRDLAAYLKRVEAGLDPTGPTERLEPEERARETAILMLRRTVVGVDRPDFALRTGFGIDDLAGEAIARHRGSGLLEDDGRRIRFTRDGLFLADHVLADFL